MTEDEIIEAGHSFARESVLLGLIRLLVEKGVLSKDEVMSVFSSSLSNLQKLDVSNIGIDPDYTAQMVAAAIDWLLKEEGHHNEIL